MDIKTWLSKSSLILESAGINTARLDALILLEDATGKDRGWLLAHPELMLQGPTLSKLDRWVERRTQHEPLAYIRGHSEFYGREFIVTPDTLQPRPETETMIELLKELIQKPLMLRVGPLASGITVVDVGTGSGCLGITAKLELPEAEVLGTDISPACTKIAEQNATKLGADVKFFHGDLLKPISDREYGTACIVLANLPYVPISHSINQAAMYEPKLAIFGGSDGLDLYRKLFNQINQLKDQPDYVLTESLPLQHEELAKIATTVNYSLCKTDDFIQVFRLFT